MKKKIIGLFLVLATLVSTAGLTFAAQPSTLNQDMDKAIEVTKSYLQESAYAQYFYEPCDVEKFTIMAVPENNRESLEQNIKNYAEFKATQAIIPYENTSITLGNISSFEENLALHQKKISYYGHINEIEGITYLYFNPSYNVVDCNNDVNLAKVNIYETLVFQYSDYNKPSMIITHYLVSLTKYDGEWLVMAVESDDLFYETYHDVYFDLQKEIASIDNVYAQKKEFEIPETNENNGQRVSLSTSDTDRKYIAKNAVNYALTYSTPEDDGKQIPSFKNNKFYWTNTSCQLFVSQCLWAGFGGSNSQVDINDRRGMDTSGAYQWWSTKSRYNNPDYNDPGSLSDKGWNSWIKCSQFKTYVDAIKSSETESGIVCDTYLVPNNSNDMVGSSGLTKTDLIGSALHVKGSSGALGHAIILTDATGTTRSTVYYTSYNNCAKNIKLSTKFPSGTASDRKIYVMVPRYLRGSNGASPNYTYADLLPTLEKGTSGVTKTLYGRSNLSVSNLTMSLFKPYANTSAYAFNSVNKSVVSGTVNFNQVGEWKVEVSGTGLKTFTYVIRVI